MSAVNLLSTESQFGDVAPFTPTGFGEVTPTTLVNVARNYASGLRMFEETPQYTDRKDLIAERFGDNYLTGITDEIKTQYPEIGTDGLLDQFENQLSRRITEGRKVEPDKWAGILTREEIEAESVRRGKSAQDISADIASRAPLVEGIAGQIVGSIGGAFTDPINAATLPFGASASMGLLRAMGMEALINAAIEAGQQEKIKEWQQRIGNKYGIGEAAIDIGTAGLGAGALTGVIRGAAPAVRGIGEVLREQSMPILERMAMSRTLPSDVRSAAAYMARLAHIDEEPLPGLRTSLLDPSEREITITNRQNLQETQDAVRNYREPVYGVTSLQDYSFRAAELSDENIARIIRRFVEPVALVEQARFSRRRDVDAFIRNDAKESGLQRSDYIVEKAPDGQYVALRGYGGLQPYRGETGEIIEYKSNSEAQAEAKKLTDSGKKAAAVSLNPQAKKSEQRHIVILGADKKIATAIKEAPEYAAFYDPARLGAQPALNLKPQKIKVEDKSPPIGAALPQEPARVGAEIISPVFSTSPEAVMAIRPTDALASMQRDVEVAESSIVNSAFDADFARLLKEQPDLKIMTESGERTLKEIADDIKDNQDILDAIRTCAIGGKQ